MNISLNQNFTSRERRFDRKYFPANLAIYVLRLIDFRGVKYTADTTQSVRDGREENCRLAMKVGCVTKQKTTYNTSSTDKQQS